MTHRSHVLHIVHSLDFGGTETQLRLIAEAQDKRFKHSFCALAAGGTCFEEIRLCGAESHLLGVNVWKRPAKAVGALLSLIRKVRPEVVHCHAADANLFGLLTAWLARAPVRIGEEVGMPTHGRKARLIYRWTYARADCIVAVSDAVARCMIELGEAPSSKIQRLHNPVRLPTNHASARQSNEPLRIACVGRLEQWKNPLALVLAAAKLNDMNVEIILAGDGSQRSEIEARVKALGLEKRVRLLGFVAKPEKLLADCHLYIQPSPSEGFGIALAEAMGAALPVIASAHGGAREFIEDGVNGWLLTRPDPDQIAASIRQAARMHPSDLAEMGKRARQAIEGRFEPSAYIRQLEDLYDQLLLRKRLA